jgi:hypothetical protein
LMILTAQLPLLLICGGENAIEAHDVIKSECKIAAPDGTAIS